MTYSFQLNERLGLEVPMLSREWTEYSEADRQTILERWETSRGRIPALISAFEEAIHARQEKLYEEEDWEATLALMNEVSDYASRINDLNILFRTQPDAILRQEPPDESAGEPNPLKKGGEPAE